MQLNENFKKRMKEMLLEEYDSYLASFEYKPYHGLRVNTLKISPEDFQKISPFELRPVTWTENGFYYRNCQPAKHPYYHAGLYYLQEPSAMLPAEILPVAPGERVLDLCAAPGGKSTELAVKLKGKGMLISNDVSASRGMALLKNIELFGIRNSIVLSEYPAKLVPYFPNWFDKILVDAPCSGEGMFRKDPSIQKAWEKQGPNFYHKLQKEILEPAVKMLRPGGKMVYSTCTFSKEENEGTLSWLLEQFPEMHILPVERDLPEGFDYGRPDWGNGNKELANCLRIWPHKLEGEGHFVALLEKTGSPDDDFKREEKKTFAALKKKKHLAVFQEANKEKKKSFSKETLEFLKKCRIDSKKERLMLNKDKVYLIPENLPELSGLRVLKPGLYLGNQRRDRFEPAQPLANALYSEEFPKCIELRSDDPNVIKYLKGETIFVDKKGLGWRLVCVDGFPLGFGKLNGDVLKNKYCMAWRLM